MKRTCTTVMAVQITSNFQKVLQCNTSSIQHPPLLNSDRRFTRWCVACTGSDTCEVHSTFLRPLSLFIRLGFFCQADSMKTAELCVLNYCTQCQNAHIALWTVVRLGLERGPLERTVIIPGECSPFLMLDTEVRTEYTAWVRMYAPRPVPAAHAGSSAIRHGMACCQAARR